jgi:hypothetical protein
VVQAPTTVAEPLAYLEGEDGVRVQLFELLLQLGRGQSVLVVKVVKLFVFVADAAETIS